MEPYVRLGKHSVFVDIRAEESEPKTQTLTHDLHVGKQSFFFFFLIIDFKKFLCWSFQSFFVSQTE